MKYLPTNIPNHLKAEARTAWSEGFQEGAKSRDWRILQLLNANNAEVERRRKAQAEVVMLRNSHDEVIQCGTRVLLQGEVARAEVARLQAALSTLAEQCDMAAACLTDAKAAKGWRLMAGLLRTAREPRCEPTNA